MICWDMCLLHTQIHMYIYTYTYEHFVMESALLLWNTARESNYFKKNNRVFTGKVIVSKGSREWTKALIVRKLLTPGLKKWPQVSNDALSLELSDAVFHSKLNCQSTAQSFSTINSHLLGKYIEKYYILPGLFQVRLSPFGNRKYVYVTGFKDPHSTYTEDCRGFFVVFLRALSNNFILPFFLFRSMEIISSMRPC